MIKSNPFNYIQSILNNINSQPAWARTNKVQPIVLKYQKTPTQPSPYVKNVPEILK